MQVFFKSNGPTIAQVIRRKGERAPAAWRASSERMKELWLLHAKMLSAVQFNTPQSLAEARHPYARRNFRGKGRYTAPNPRTALPMPAYYISRQRGGVYEGWEGSVEESNGVIAVRLTNRAPCFHWLHTGTRKMISRPLLAVALARASKQFPELYTEAQLRVHDYK
jgi:hypothetical protein